MADKFAYLLQVLAQSGCQCYAVLGITSIQALSDRAGEAASQGVDAEDIAKILLAARSTPQQGVETSQRADLPVRRHYSSASFDAALQAALPQNRKRAPDDLDHNLLARSSTQPMETRVKAWQRLCEGDVKPWPISFNAVKKVCASLRQGGYTVEGYLHAASKNSALRSSRSSAGRPPAASLPDDSSNPLTSTPWPMSSTPTTTWTPLTSRMPSDVEFQDDACRWLQEVQEDWCLGQWVFVWRAEGPRSPV